MALLSINIFSVGANGVMRYRQIVRLVAWGAAKKMRLLGSILCPSLKKEKEEKN